MRPSRGHLIKLPLTDENEIGANMQEVEEKLMATGYYQNLFANAFGGNTKITETKIIDALAHFIRSMTSFNSKFDQEADNNFAGFTHEEDLGRKLFAADCSIYHVQGLNMGTMIPIALQAAPFFFNNGLESDPEDLGVGEWLEGFEDLFKVTTLKNIELTAPYMHDGRFKTLEEVVDHYSDEATSNHWNFFIPDGGFGYDEEEKVALVAFLKTLTDKSFITEPKWSNPFAKSNTKELHIEDIVLKPNPMTDEAVIEFSNNKGKLVSINVYNVNGQLLKHDQTQSAQYRILKDDYPSGTYFVELIMGEARSTQQLIIY